MTDFGISKFHEEDKTEGYTSVKGTTGYLDPEYFRTNKLTYKSDVYAFGVVLLEIICGRPPIQVGGHTPVTDFVTLADFVGQMLSKGRVEAVADRSLKTYIKEAMWKVAELALHCVEPLSINRPDMREVVRELSEATQYEKRTNSVAYGQGMWSQTSEYDETEDMTRALSQNSRLGDSSQSFTENPNSRFPHDGAPRHGLANPSRYHMSNTRQEIHENSTTDSWGSPRPR